MNSAAPEIPREPALDRAGRRDLGAVLLHQVHQLRGGAGARQPGQPAADDGAERAEGEELQEEQEQEEVQRVLGHRGGHHRSRGYVYERHLRIRTVWGGRLRKGLCNMFSESSPLLAWAVCQLQFSPMACGILRKHFTKPFTQTCRPALY